MLPSLVSTSGNFNHQVHEVEGIFNTQCNILEREEFKIQQFHIHSNITLIIITKIKIISHYHNHDEHDYDHYHNHDLDLDISLRYEYHNSL